MVVDPKTIFYEAKPKKTAVLENGVWILKKMFFLFYIVKRWFFMENPFKKMVLEPKTNFFPRKKMVFLRQTRPKPSFYVGKVDFSMETIFLRGNTKKTIFIKIPPFLKKIVFFLVFVVLPRKRWFWSQKPTFTSQNDGFPEADQTKTIFFTREKWVFL